MIPIVFTHFGSKLKEARAVFKRAVSSNPKAKVILITDVFDYKDKVVENISMDNLAIDFEPIARSYLHLSPNAREFELWCLQRHFYVRKLMEMRGYERVFCLDSDVLLFEDVNLDFKNWKQYESAITGIMPNGYLSIKTLVELTDDIRAAYTNHFSDQFRELMLLYLEMKRLRIFAGISDMSFFQLLRQKYPTELGHLEHPLDGGMYDPQINEATLVYDNGKGIKRLVRKDNYWWATARIDDNLLKMKSLHFQGGMKSLLHQFIP